MWTIRKIVKKGEYDYAVVPEHPHRTKYNYVLLHRVVMENHLGRMLTDDEEVHHKDKDGHNNSVSNLEVLTKEQHRIIHAKEKTRKYIELVCPICRRNFIIEERFSFLVKKDKEYTCCSRSCGGKASTSTIKEAQVIVRRFRAPFIGNSHNKEI